MKSFSLVDAAELQMLMDKLNELEVLNQKLSKELEALSGDQDHKAMTWSEYVPADESLFFTQ